MKNLFSKIIDNSEILVLTCLLMLILTFSLICYNVNYNFNNQNEFSELAYSFINGKVYLLNSVKNVDLVNFNDHIYWHMPPFPAIILMPLTFILQMPINQDLVNFLLNIFLFLLIYRLINKRFNFSRLNSIWLTIMYFFSSIYISSFLLKGPYYYAHTVATILIILGFYEFFGKKRFWLIGILLGLILLTRLTAFFIIIFFILAIIFDNTLLKNKIKNLILLFIPVIVCFLLLGSYNYLRFENFLESGYTLSNSYQDVPGFHPFGQFSIKYIPTNFYYYFIEGIHPLFKIIPPGHYYQLIPPYILPNPNGATSFFIISPLFLLIFKADLKNKIIKYLLFTSLVILLILLSYYYNGWPQIGPRYANDFLPLLFIIMLFYFKNQDFTLFHKFIISFSALLNIFLCLILSFYKFS